MFFRDSAALGVSNENLWWYLKYNDLDVDVACDSYAGMKVRGSEMTMWLNLFVSMTKSISPECRPRRNGEWR